MRYRLRTLLILLAVLPPLLAVSWWGYERWRQPTVTWEEAIRLAGMVRGGGGSFIAEGK